VPLGRFALPADVAEASRSWRIRPPCGFINRVALPVDGGWSSDASWRALRLATRRPSD
jgi:hypothetical protein